MCELCKGMYDDKIIKTECCNHNCHSKCNEILKKRLDVCPICKKGSEIRIYLDYGNIFYYDDEYERLEKMYNNFVPNRNKLRFGKTINVYIPKYGDFQDCAEIRRLEIIDLAHEFNEDLKTVDNAEKILLLN